MSVQRIAGCLLEPGDSPKSSLNSSHDSTEKIGKAGRLPSAVDYSSQLLPVRDQGSSDQCVAYATCTMKEHQDSVGSYLEVDDLYAQRKNPKGSGMYVSDALDVLVRRGVAPNPQNHRIKIWTQEYPPKDTLDSVKTALVMRGICVASFPCDLDAKDEKFWRVDSTSNQNGHAVALVGYDDSKESFKLRNSWGRGYGDNGYAWISYSDFRTYCRAAYSTIDSDGLPNPEKAKGCNCILM
jgi:hypothetical protein